METALGMGKFSAEPDYKAWHTCPALPLSLGLYNLFQAAALSISIGYGVTGFKSLAPVYYCTIVVSTSLFISGRYWLTTNV